MVEFEFMMRQNEQIISYVYLYICTFQSILDRLCLAIVSSILALCQYTTCNVHRPSPTLSLWCLFLSCIFTHSYTIQ